MVSGEQLLALVKRLEETEGWHDRDLDADIHLALNAPGWIIWKQTQYTGESYPVFKFPSKDYVQGFGHYPVPQYTWSVEAALGLIPDNDEGQWHFYISNRAFIHNVFQKGLYKCAICPPNESGIEKYEGISPSLAISICIAALKAHADIKEDK